MWICLISPERAEVYGHSKGSSIYYFTMGGRVKREMVRIGQKEVRGAGLSSFLFFKVSKAGRECYPQALPEVVTLMGC